MADAVVRLNQGGIHLILLDLELTEDHELEAINVFHRLLNGVPVIVLASQPDAELAADFISRGAQDFLIKDKLNGGILTEAMHKAVARQKFAESGNGDRILLRTLMEHIPDAIYFKDRFSRFLLVNRAQASRFRLVHPGGAVGMTDHDFFSQEHADQALADEQAILQTGKPVSIEELETWPDGSPTWVSTTKLPLRDPSGKIIGTFGISRDITERKRDREVLAARTLELERKNLQVAEELGMARELQMAMLPHQFPSVPHGISAEKSALGFYSFYSPSGAVSGDFFSVMPLSDNRVGVFICDVMGHDVRAALVTAMLRALVEEPSLAARDPGAVLAQVNHSLFDVFKQTGAAMYATAFYLIADVKRGELHFASAGHPDPLQLCRQTGRVEQMAGSHGQKKGPALGLFENARFPTYTRRMDSGDLIALYTDGLIETYSPDQRPFTQEMLAAAVHRRAQLPSPELFAGVISEIHDFSGSSEFEDDVCLIGMDIRRLELAG